MPLVFPHVQGLPKEDIDWTVPSWLSCTRPLHLSSTFVCLFLQKGGIIWPETPLAVD